VISSKSVIIRYNQMWIRENLTNLLNIQARDILSRYEKLLNGFGLNNSIDEERIARVIKILLNKLTLEIWTRKFAWSYMIDATFMNTGIVTKSFRHVLKKHEINWDQIWIEFDGFGIGHKLIVKVKRSWQSQSGEKLTLSGNCGKINLTRMVQSESRADKMSKGWRNDI